tara:strand:- start:9177 stop:10001 length:825 start_codon:yes stop_codon:yes gene_type:complete
MNNSYQFIHVETYCDKPRKNSLRPSAEAVARECQRLENSFPHIKNPLPPELIYGIQPLDALNEVRSNLKNCKDPIGRKIRSDAQIIAFGVASIKIESTPENWESEEVKKWVKDTITFLEHRFGSSFVSATTHKEEQFCHLHFGSIPKVGENGLLDLTSFHPGLAAQRSVTTKTKKAKYFAYKEAMRTFQDEYFEAVGIKNGLLRHGPRRRRLSRKEWFAQKRYAELISKLFNEKSSLIQTLNTRLERAKGMLTDLISVKIINKNQQKTSNLEKL